MENQQQQHSYIEKPVITGPFMDSNVRSHSTTGTRFKEVFESQKIIRPTSNANGQIVMMPLFNSLIINQGSSASERSGNSIFIHRIELSYSIRENPGNVNGPDEAGVANSTAGSNVLTDSRYRILMVTPKQTYRFAPVSNPLTFPYYQANVDNNHPEPVQIPVINTQVYDFGMIGLPDPKRFNVEYDDLRNLKMNSNIGQDSGSFSFLIRRRFDYDQDLYANNGQIRFQNNEMQYLIPQIFMYFPPQTLFYGSDGLASGISTFAGLMLSWNVRIIYDNVN